MTIFKLKMELGTNGAKDADDVVARLGEILPRIAAKVGEDGEFGLIRDEDGKRIGRWDFSDNDPGEFVVGEADTTPDNPPSTCNSMYYDSDGDERWECTRERGHKGIHATGNGDTIQAVWNDVYGG